VEWARATNDSIREAAEQMDGQGESTYVFFCECACREQFTLTLTEFDRRRKNGRAILLRGHTGPTTPQPAT